MAWAVDIPKIEDGLHCGSPVVSKATSLSKWKTACTGTGLKQPEYVASSPNDRPTPENVVREVGTGLAAPLIVTVLRDPLAVPGDMATASNDLPPGAKLVQSFSSRPAVRRRPPR
jgi:hypothetical protein